MLSLKVDCDCSSFVCGVWALLIVVCDCRGNKHMSITPAGVLAMPIHTCMLEYPTFPLFNPVLEAS